MKKIIPSEKKTSLLENILTKDIGLPNVPKILYYILFAALAANFITYTIHACQCIAYPYQIDYGEGYMLYLAKTVADGGTIYTDISELPSIPGLYTPVYTIICALFIKIFGVSFTIGRIISIVSALIIGYLVYKIAEKYSDRRSALIALLFFFALPYVYRWSCLFRVDMLALLFSLVGIYLFLKYERNKKIYLCIPFFLLAVFTKQSMIIAPLAAFIYLFLKDKKMALKVFGLLGITGIILFLICNLLTDWQFYNHVIIYQSLPFVWYQLSTKFGEFIETHYIISILAGGIALYYILRKRIFLLSIYLLITLLSIISIGRVGASSNYLLELLVICCIFIAILLKEVCLHIKKGDIFGIAVVTLLLLQSISFLGDRQTYIYGPTSEDHEVQQKISILIENSKGTVLTEDAGMSIINGKDLVIEWFMDTQLSLQGLWDQTAFVESIKNRQYSVIILESNAKVKLTQLKSGRDENYSEDEWHNIVSQRFTVEMLEVIIDNYQLSEQLGDFFIYYPK
jgi:hypothetical protein